MDAKTIPLTWWEIKQIHKALGDRCKMIAGIQVKRKKKGIALTEEEDRHLIKLMELKHFIEQYL